MICTNIFSIRTRNLDRQRSQTQCWTRSAPRQSPAERGAGRDRCDSLYRSGPVIRRQQSESYHSDEQCLCPSRPSQPRQQVRALRLCPSTNSSPQNKSRTWRGDPRRPASETEISSALRPICSSTDGSYMRTRALNVLVGVLWNCMSIEIAYIYLVISQT